MCIKTDDMDLGGDIVQSLATYLDIMVCTGLVVRWILGYPNPQLSKQYD